MHELTIRKSGKVEMAYTGETPWHGLGEQLQVGADLETWLKAAGMDWRIQRSKVRYAADRDGKEFRTIDDRHVMMRSDTKDYLGIVSDSFKVVQPRDVLEFFRGLTESAGFKIETAGTLFGGQRFWALASTGESATIIDPKDRVRGFLLLSTSCDGTMATEARYTDVRVVCHNTLSAARQDKARVRVTHRSKFDASAVRRELGVEKAHERFADTMAKIRLLAVTPIRDASVISLTAELIRPGAAELAKEEFKKVLDMKPVEAISALAIENRTIGADMDGAHGTYWGWLNAVTQYVDHSARARSVDNRLNSAWFGRGDDLKSRAFDLAVEAAG